MVINTDLKIIDLHGFVLPQTFTICTTVKKSPPLSNLQSMALTHGAKKINQSP